MKRPLFLSHNLSIPPIRLLALMSLYLFFILGCSVFNRGTEPPPPETGESTAAQPGTLVCSEECAARGQCGHLQSDNQPVILGHPERPAVQEHQMIFPANTALPIVGVQDVVIQVLATGEQFNQPFYLVQRPDERTGWVAGWCITPQ